MVKKQRKETESDLRIKQPLNLRKETGWIPKEGRAWLGDLCLHAPSWAVFLVTFFGGKKSHSPARRQRAKVKNILMTKDNFN